MRMGKRVGWIRQRTSVAQSLCAQVGARCCSRRKVRCPRPFFAQPRPAGLPHPRVGLLAAGREWMACCPVCCCCSLVYLAAQMCHACAVDAFMIGKFSVSCAAYCSPPPAKCTLFLTGKGLVGTLPDLFDRLSCASRLEEMYRLTTSSRAGTSSA